MIVPDPRERPVVSVPEAGELLGLGRSAAYDAVTRGELPTLRFGRRLVVPTARLRQMLGLDAADYPGTGDAAIRPGLALVKPRQATGR